MGVKAVKYMGGSGGEPEVRGIDHNNKRSSLIALRQAVESGQVVISGPLWEGVPAQIRRIADEDPCRRTRLRAYDLLRAMRNDTVNAAVALDKIERLDDGGPTERIETLSPESREIAERLLRRARPDAVDNGT